MISIRHCVRALAARLPAALLATSAAAALAQTQTDAATTRNTGRAAVIASANSRPFAPIRKIDDDGQVAEIEMFAGESRVFPVPGVARIAVGNGAILTA